MSPREAGWYADPNLPGHQRFWDGQSFIGDASPIGTAAPARDAARDRSSEAPAAPVAAAVAAPANPAAAAIALLGSILVLVGSFLPVRSLGNVPILHNSFVANHDWWVLAVAVVAAAFALRVLIGGAAGGAAAIGAMSAIALFAGIKGQSSSFQRVAATTNVGQQLFGSGSLKTSPGVGVYLVLAGGAIGLLGAIMMVRRPSASEATRTKACPDCAETVLADARVCKHCGYRFDADAVTS